MPENSVSSNSLRDNHHPFAELTTFALNVPYSPETVLEQGWISAALRDEARRLIGSSHKFLLTSSIDPVRNVFVVRNAWTERFVDQLRFILQPLGIALIEIDTRHRIPPDDRRRLADVWAQDTVQFLEQFAIHDGSLHREVSRLPAIRGGHRGFVRPDALDLEAASLTDSLGIRSAADIASRRSRNWLDWYGNLTVSPPIRTPDGRMFPFGRAIVGIQSGRSIHPAVLEFLQQQGLQWPPVFIDTTWLQIGHPDEVVLFVPSRSRLGFKALIPSPRSAWEILQSCADSGFGDTTAFQGKKNAIGRSAEVSVSQLLRDRTLGKKNRQVEAALRATRVQLMDELGLIDDDFIEVPVLFKGNCFENGIALNPNGVNSLVVNRHIVMPDPCGPTIDGEDVFFAPAERALTGEGLTVHRIDAWDPYHNFWGEVHCGTNAIRASATLGLLS